MTVKSEWRVDCGFEIIDALEIYSVGLGGVMPVLKM